MTMAAKFDLNDDRVVVVIGSGAGGGTLSNELAQKGIKVVCLEAGARHELTDFVNNEWEMFSKISWLDKRTTSGSWRVAKDFPNLPAWIVKAVGGTTIHWAGASLRLQEHEFRTRTVYGEVPGANLLDWPVTLAELEPWYARAEDKMGVTGTNGIPRLPGNNNYKVLAAGAKRVGYREFHTGNMAINSEPRAGRGSCQQIGFCFQGCLSGAKWSTLYTEIPLGEATGKLEVRPNSQVLKIEHDEAGKVTGVIYADAAGALQRQRARIVAVAGNSIESPRLLLNSASSRFPDGLANSSGQVGRNYMRHMTGSVYAVFEKPVHAYRGTTMAGMWLIGEDMPRETNRVTLHATEKDKYNLPIPNVHFDDHDNDVAMRNHAFKQGTAVYDSLGAVRTIQTPPYPSTHNLGTNRMSANARDGVVNKWGQTHDVKNLFVSDGSQFTTGGAENPTLTIVALAIRQADYMADQMSRREI